MVDSTIPSHYSGPRWCGSQNSTPPAAHIQGSRRFGSAEAQLHLPAGCVAEKEAILRMASNFVKVPQISTIFLLFVFYPHLA
jgi:hypothetical protein